MSNSENKLRQDIHGILTDTRGYTVSVSNEWIEHIIDRVRAEESVKPEPISDETPTECTHGVAVYWNPYNQVVQCHDCGQEFVPKVYDMRDDEESGVCNGDPPHCTAVDGCVCRDDYTVVEESVGVADNWNEPTGTGNYGVETVENQVPPPSPLAHASTHSPMPFQPPSAAWHALQTPCTGQVYEYKPLSDTCDCALCRSGRPRSRRGRWT
jgi:hypothetical protein